MARFGLAGDLFVGDKPDENGEVKVKTVHNFDGFLTSEDAEALITHLQKVFELDDTKEQD